MALMTTMFFTMLMLMLAAALVTNASTETQISANHVAQLQAFYAAEAELEQAKAWLTANRTDTELMDTLLVESQNANPDHVQHHPETGSLARASVLCQKVTAAVVG